MGQDEGIYCFIAWDKELIYQGGYLYMEQWNRWLRGFGGENKENGDIGLLGNMG